MQKAPHLKHPGNPRHKAKIKPKENMYRRQWRLPSLMASKYFEKIVEEKK